MLPIVKRDVNVTHVPQTYWNHYPHCVCSYSQSSLAYYVRRDKHVSYACLLHISITITVIEVRFIPSMRL